MLTITVRELMDAPRQGVLAIPRVDCMVVYDDGVSRQHTYKQIIFNRYCWELFTMYPGVGIPSSCDVTNFYTHGHYTADSHIRLLEKIFGHICEECNIEAYSDKKPLLAMVYKVVDYIQNELINSISDSVTTMDAVDLIAVVNSEEVMAIHANMKPTPEGIERAYKDIKKYVTTSTKPNQFLQAYRSKAANDNQSNQCIGPRGFNTDLDRTVFKQAVTSGFIRGMSSLYEMMVESCTAAKSLNANGSHIQISEYTSRRIQLLSMPVERVVNGDCGSKEYMDIFITPQVLENLKGIYYLKSDETLGCLTGDEEELFNTVIKIRTALGCTLTDSSCVCSTCLGKIAQNFSENTNLGYTMAASLMERVTQAILSTKHLTHSVKKALIRLEGLATKYFRTDENGDLFLHSDLNLKGLQLILPNSSVGRLVDVLNLKHTNIGLSKIGELDSIAVRDTKPSTPTTEKLDISYKDRNCVITRELLAYIKTSNMESDSRGNFVIPLDAFDKEQPIFNNPLKETNILNFVNRVAAIIETSKDAGSDPYDKLNLLFSTVIDKFKCNLSVLQILVYATTTYNASQNNYCLGRNSPTTSTAGKVMLSRYRDFGGMAFYEKQATEITDHPTVAFSSKIPRQQHPMSVFLTPAGL